MGTLQHAWRPGSICFFLWGTSLSAALKHDGRSRARHARAPRQPDDYDLWTAKQKIDWLKKNTDIDSGNNIGAPWWAEEGRVCANLECVHKGGINERADVVNPYECRIHGLHPDGIVAWVKIVWEPNNYTGLFQEEPYGLARWGYQHWTDEMAFAASFPGVNDSLYPENVSSFMAMKFFRDGVPSSNIHLSGADMNESSWSFLHKGYTNMGPGMEVKFNVTSEDTLNNIAEQAPLRSTVWPGFTGLHDLAMFNSKGQLQQNARAPFQFIVLPTQTAFHIEQRSCVGNLSAMTSNLNSLMAASGLGLGTRLFEIWSKDHLLLPMTLLGYVELWSEFTTSADVDRQLYFSHQRFERDLVMRPEFLHTSWGCRDWWHCPVCPSQPQFCIILPETVWAWVEYLEGRLDFDVMLDVTQKFVFDASEYISSSESSRDAFARSTIRTLLKTRSESQAAALKAPRTRRRSSLFSCIGSRRASHAIKEKDRPRELGMLSTDHNVANGSNAVVDELTHMVYADWMVCPEQSCEECWPLYPRDATACASQPVDTGLPETEPELVHAISPGCSQPPACSTSDGTWYSSHYPCACGSSVCSMGGLCHMSSSTCQEWGPLAESSRISKTSDSSGAFVSEHSQVQNSIRRVYQTIATIPYKEDTAANGMHSVSLLTLQETGFPSARGVVPRFISDDLFEIRLSTQANARMVVEIQKHQSVSVIWNDQERRGGWIMIKGTATTQLDGRDRITVVVNSTRIQAMGHDVNHLYDTEGWPPAVLDRTAVGWEPKH